MALLLSVRYLTHPFPNAPTDTVSAVPPMPTASIFDRFALPISLPFGMSGSADKQTRAAPPQVDTSAASMSQVDPTCQEFLR